MATAKCPVCLGVLNYPPQNAGWQRSLGYSCRRCGDYYLTSEATHVIPKNPRQRAVLSHAIRRMQHNESKPPLLKQAMVEAIIESPLPEASEQVANFIVWLGTTTTSGEYTPLKEEPLAAILGVVNANGVYWVRDYLKSEGFILGKTMEWKEPIYDQDFNEPGPNVSTHQGEGYALSFKGWERFREIRRGALDSRKAFMAMQYGDAELDRVFRECFQPGVADTGFTLKLLYEEPKAGSIDDRMRAELLTSRFVIADLTHENRGAYWEAGFAEGAGKPVIYTCKKGHIPEVHFDTNHHLIVEWDPDDLLTTATKLKNTIRATLPDEARQED